MGSMLVLSAFVLLAVRGFKAARNARDMYGYLLAMGTTCWLIFQAIINLAVLMAFMPNTGMPLPFISAGGSSMMATLLGVGILLNVSRDSATGRTLRKVER